MSALPNLDAFAHAWFRRKSVEAQLQSESAECGAACLAMISTYYGYRTTVAELRGRFGSSARGMTLASIIGVAGDLRFSSRPVKIELLSLKRLRLPAILHWDLDHFVVVEQINDRRVVIVDPAIGRRSMAMSECSKHFTGIALELQPSPDFERKAAPVGIKFRDFVKNTHGLRKTLGLIFLVSLALQTISLLSPLMTQLILDQSLMNGDESFLVVLALSFGALAILQAGIGFARSLAIFHLGANLKFQWGSRLFHHLIRLPLTYFERRQIGDIMSRFNSMAAIQSLVTTTVIEAVLDGLLAVTTLTVMLMYSATLASISVGVLLIALIMRVVVLPAHRSESHTAILHAAREDSHLLETLRGMLTIKSFGLESLREAGWQGHAANEIRSGLASNLFPTTERSIAQLLLAFENIAVFTIGASFVMKGTMTVGMLVAFTSYKLQFTGRASGLIDKAIDYKLASIQTERLADIILEPEEFDGLATSDFVQIGVKGELSVKDLGYRYSPSDPYVIKDLSFSVRAGECLVITGSSGIGKTTLLKMLMGLFLASEGKITVDGVEIKPATTKSYRSQIAAVMQEDTLLNGSILDNITLFDPIPDSARVDSVVGLSALTTVISSLPMGLSTHVGDMGSALSGGQRQRLLLARALSRQPNILFLDEATAHLDVTTESRIHETLSSMGITRVVISHRPGTVDLADTVLNLDSQSTSGRVISIDKKMIGGPLADRSDTAGRDTLAIN